MRDNEMSNAQASPAEIPYCNVAPPPCIEWPPLPPNTIQPVAVPALDLGDVAGLALLVVAVAVRKMRRGRE